MFHFLKIREKDIPKSTLSHHFKISGTPV